jgi:bifunctional non-homologous end joining protein LigD
VSDASLRPRVIRPMMPTRVHKPPAGESWIHEIKHDGYRTLLAVKARPRAPSLATLKQYRTIVASAAQLPCQTAIVDGEMVVQDESGRADFHVMRAALCREPERLAFFAFDLLMKALRAANG